MGALGPGSDGRLSPAELDALTRMRPRRALAGLAGELLLIAAAILACQWTRHWLVVVAAAVWIGARQHALLVIMHDVVHRRFLPSRRLSEWIGGAIAWCLFIDMGAFRHAHLGHHRHLFDAGDYEGPSRLFADATVTSWPRLAWFLLRSAWPIRGQLWLVLPLYSELSRHGIAAAGSVAAARRRFTLRMGVLALAAATAAVGGLLAELTIYWLLPFVFVLPLSLSLRDLVEHCGVPAGDASPGTRSTEGRLWERLLIAPRNINLHGAHHLYPSIPLYNLPAAHRILRSRGAFQGAHAPAPTYGQALRDWLRFTDRLRLDAPWRDSWLPEGAPALPDATGLIVLMTSGAPSDLANARRRVLTAIDRHPDLPAVLAVFPDGAPELDEWTGLRTSAMNPSRARQLTRNLPVVAVGIERGTVRSLSPAIPPSLLRVLQGGLAPARTGAA